MHAAGKGAGMTVGGEACEGAPARSLEASRPPGAPPCAKGCAQAVASRSSANQSSRAASRLLTRRCSSCAFERAPRVRP